MCTVNQTRDITETDYKMKPGFPLQMFKYYVKTKCKPPVYKEILTLHIENPGTYYKY